MSASPARRNAASSPTPSIAANCVSPPAVRAPPAPPAPRSRTIRCITIGQPASRAQPPEPGRGAGERIVGSARSSACAAAANPGPRQQPLPTAIPGLHGACRRGRPHPKRGQPRRKPRRRRRPRQPSRCVPRMPSPQDQQRTSGGRGAGSGRSQQAASRSQARPSAPARAAAPRRLSAPVTHSDPSMYLAHGGSMNVRQRGSQGTLGHASDLRRCCPIGSIAPRTARTHFSETTILSSFGPRKHHDWSSK